MSEAQHLGRRAVGRPAPSVARVPAVVVVLPLLGACAGLGNLPPVHEVEHGLPGNVTQERTLFGWIEKETRPDGALQSAVRPFLVTTAGTDGTVRRDILTPIAAQTVSEGRRHTRVWPLFSTDSVGDEAERAAGATNDDTVLLPILGWGTDPGQEPWWMFFPLAGHVRQKLFADEIDFAAFPLWTRTRAGDWHSTHVLWPLIAWGEGEGRSHARFLPFWSQSDGPDGSKRTAAWPFLHWSTLRTGDRTFDGWFLFPLLGHRTASDDSYREWTVLWPFFSWSDDARTGDRNRSLFWPIHREIERSADHESSTWWWPFWGTYSSDAETSSFYAWPLVWSAEFRDDGGPAGRTTRRTFVVPLWMERESGPTGGAPDTHEVRSWPLFSFERTATGEETLRVPELIPFFGWKAGETAWSDLLAVFRRTADAEGRAAWDLPLGIVRWRRDERGASKLTLFWWIDVPTGGPSDDAADRPRDEAAK